MWKDFFYFSKIQRIGIVVLLSLIVLTLIGGILLPYILPKNEMTVDEQFMAEAKAFKSTLKDKEPTWKNYERKSYRAYTKEYYAKKDYESAYYQLFAFDPNTTDSVGFVKLGLKPFIAKNILKYRSKGGKFKNADAFAKVYGISPEKFEELKPYINIKEVEKVSEAKKTESAPALTSTKKDDIVLDLNTADTAQLMQVKGIGRGYAKGIVGYRKVLGGYYSVEQLREVYGMRPENFEKIRFSFTADGSQIRKINVNTASLERLRSHPYIRSFEKAKAIYEYRRKKVKLKNMDDLSALQELTEEDLRKLTPYLEFK